MRSSAYIPTAHQEETREGSRQEASRQLADIDAQYEANKPRMQAQLQEAAALDEEYKTLMAMSKADLAETKRGLQHAQDLNRRFQEMLAADGAEVQQVNAQTLEFRRLVDQHTRRRDETMAFLKSVVQQRANSVGTREWAAKIHNTLARTGKVEDVNWLKNTFGRDTKDINDLAARIAVMGPALKSKQATFQAHRAAFQKFEREKIADDNAAIAKVQKDDSAMKQRWADYDRRKKRFADERSLLVREQAELLRKMIRVKQAQQELDEKHTK